jgi:hypothetical protein
MKFDVQLPIRVRAVPKGFRNLRDLLLSERISVDVPEYSLSETHEVVIPKIGGAHGEVDVIRMLGGLLYRPIHPHSKFNVAYAGGTIGLHEGWLHSEAPLAEPILGVYERQSRLMGSRVELSAPFEFGSQPFPRTTTLERFLGLGARNIDWETVDVAQMMHASQTARLVYVDGNLFVRTPPPAIMVNTTKRQNNVQGRCRSRSLARFLRPQAAALIFPAR